LAAAATGGTGGDGHHRAENAAAGHPLGARALAPLAGQAIGPRGGPGAGTDFTRDRGSEFHVHRSAECRFRQSDLHPGEDVPAPGRAPGGGSSEHAPVAEDRTEKVVEAPATPEAPEDVT